MNSKIVKSTGINQWKNTDAVIKWFNKMPNKANRSFICFDIVDFYPSISEELLNEALSFDDITENEKAIIMKAKQSLLFNKSTTWRKKTSNSLFDVTMGSFDGAETCELVGSYLLSKLSAEYGNDIGLYRDDGLAAFNKSPRETENIKKRICKVFNDHNLKITIEANKKYHRTDNPLIQLPHHTRKPCGRAASTIVFITTPSHQSRNVKKTGIYYGLTPHTVSTSPRMSATNSYKL